MKKLFLIPACVLFIALALTQTTQAAGTRTYANKTGSITVFEPGRSITINANILTHETKYILASNVEYSRKGGGPVTPGLFRTGSRVELGFNSAGKVNRIRLVEGH